MFLINGASGQLGSELLRLLGDRGKGMTRVDFDLTDPKGMESALHSIKPCVIINCSAYTAVDLAEDNPELCFSVNAEGVKHLAAIATELDALLVQISTDYVFAGANDTDGPLHEETPTSPRGVYAASKMAGERYAATCPRHLIVRTCGLYGVTPKRANFVETMLRVGQQRDELRVVADQRCNPTSTSAVADAVLKLIERECLGLFHVVSSTSMSWFEFASEIIRQASIPTRVIPITTQEYNARAPRPSYSVLDTTKYQLATGSHLPAIADDLANYLCKRS